MNIELVYDADCPNVGATRQRLAEALAAAGIAVQWREWDRSESGTPDYVRRCGSPTILVDGRDILPPARLDGECACRVYEDATGRTGGVPSTRAIEDALRTALTNTTRQSHTPK